MVAPGFIRWALTIVVILLILALMAAAAVVMASAILEPQVTPEIKLQPALAKPGDIVAVTGKGWPSLGAKEYVVVIALSPTRDLASESLQPVGATNVALDGTFATTFVLPADVPWTALKEAWVVARPATGNLQATARLVVLRALATATPKPAAATTPLAGRQQIQGVIEQVSPDQPLIIVRPFDNSAGRGVNTRAAALTFADGHTATHGELRVGRSVAAFGWLDSGGILLAEQIMILEVSPGLTPAAVLVIPATGAPAPTGTAAPIVVCTPIPATAKPGLPGPAPVVLVTCTSKPPPPTPVPTDVWVGQYYPNPWHAGPPVLERQDRVVDFNWRNGAPAPGLPEWGYSVRWAGYWQFPRTCRYRFLLLIKGNARLIVDGQVLINQWDAPPAAEYATEVNLAEGLHNLIVEYSNKGSAGRVQLRWEYAAPTV